MFDVLFATNRFPGDGTTTQFEISFAGGYMDKSHVKAYIEDVETKVRTEITVTTGMFTGPFTLDLGVFAPVGSNMVLYRDTPKDAPLVDFVNGSRITEANLDKVAQQSVFIGAEIFDSTRVGEVLALLDDAGAEATASVLIAQAAASAAAGSAVVSETHKGAAEAAALSAVASADAASAVVSSVLAAADDAADSAAAAANTAAALAGGSIGFTAASYDFGMITDETTYFNRDFGLIV